MGSFPSRAVGGRWAARQTVVGQAVAAGVVGIALVAVLTVALLAAVSAQERMTTRIEHSGHVLGVAHVAERRVVDLETGIRGYSATNARLFLAPYWSARRALPAQLSSLAQLVADHPAEVAQVRGLQRATAAYIRHYTAPFVAAPHPLRGHALFVYTLVGKRMVDRLRRRFTRLDAQQDAVQSHLESQARRTDRRLRDLGLIAAAILLAGLLALGGWVARAVVMPLRRGSRALGRLAAGERDLRIHESGAAEVRLFARSFNEAAHQLAQREQQLHYLADHDALTGLHNRGRFNAELERLTSEARRYDRRGAVLVLDLDGFKLVNDRFGHAVGDELVARVAAILRRNVRETDVVARIGGDEFAIVLLQAGREEARAVAEKIIDAVRHEGTVGNDQQTARVTTSIGITTYDGACKLSGDELAVEADIAMYDAKASGRDRAALYDRAGDRRELLSQRHSWRERLRAAIEQDRFVLHAQPITGIRAGGVRGYELLLRMLSDDGDLIPPATFLYNAERFDLMGDIDRWVLRRAVRLLHDHTEAGNQISLAVNLSGKTMNDLELADDLAVMLAEHPIPEGRLIIEVTETAAIVNIDRARQLAQQLRGLGCRFALDDFGAGFASFYYLKHLDFDYLKIDGEFVQKLTQTPTDRLVVQAVVDIAQGLGSQTVAEFVEDQATVELLRDLGVDYGQGYHLGRPGPLEERLPPLPAPLAQAR